MYLDTGITIDVSASISSSLKGHCYICAISNEVLFFPSLLGIGVGREVSYEHSKKCSKYCCHWRKHLRHRWL